MRVQFAHVNIQGVNVAIFDAKPMVNTDAHRAELLAQLTAKARLARLRVDKSALAYMEGGRVVYYGTPDLVRYLQSAGLPSWTNWVEA